MGTKNAPGDPRNLRRNRLAQLLPLWMSKVRSNLGKVTEQLSDVTREYGPQVSPQAGFQGSAVCKHIHVTLNTGILQMRI